MGCVTCTNCPECDGTLYESVEDGITVLECESCKAIYVPLRDYEAAPTLEGEDSENVASR